MEFGWSPSRRRPLREFGAEVLWSPRAELPKISGNLDMGPSDVYHATTLRIDESCTESTAVTVGFGSGYGRRPKAMEVRFDPPHLFAVPEETIAAILSCGPVAYPNERGSGSWC